MRIRIVQRLGLLLLDTGFLIVAIYGIHWWRFRTGMFTNPLEFRLEDLAAPAVIITAYWILVFAWFGLYRFDPLNSRAATAAAALKATAVGVLILFMLTFDPNRPLPGSRVILATYGIAIFLIAGGNRIGLLTIMREFRLRGVGLLRTLLIGGQSRAVSALAYAKRHPELGLAIHGMLTSADPPDPQLTARQLGGYEQLVPALKTGEFRAVLFAMQDAERGFLQRLMHELRPFGVRAFIAADQYRDLVGQVKPTRLYGHPLVEIRPELLAPVERLMKRVTDLVIASFLLLITLPVWIVLAVAIPLESRGPAFYFQQRVGLNGRSFRLLKFRSMRRDAEAQSGAVLAIKRDPRITRLGRMIRPIRLDELPQLLNVLRGDMSLVGPRPERREFVERFMQEIPLYERRLNVKPGLTGWSQVHLKYDARADQIPLKLQYDFFYIENMSLPLDVKIMFMTLFVMLRGEGI